MANLAENIVTCIQKTIRTKYNGLLDCEQQRADLFVWVEGNEERIKAVDEDYIYFHNSEFDIDLYEADIAHLVYLDKIINPSNINLK